MTLTSLEARLREAADWIVLNVDPLERRDLAALLREAADELSGLAERLRREEPSSMSGIYTTGYEDGGELDTLLSGVMKNSPTNIDTRNWFYDEEDGINVVHEVVRDGVAVQTDSIRIPWSLIRDAVARKGR